METSAEMKPKLVAGVLLVRGPGVFLAKRVNQEKPMPGFYCDLGGGVELGETPEQTVLREAWEEGQVRLMLGELRKLGVFQVLNDREPREVHEFYVELAEGLSPVVPPDEEENLGPWEFFTLGDAFELPLLPSVRQALEAYKEELDRNRR
jgi:8-oxo-dGTP pyrophosphatase MutT (NUDIX family)